MQNWQLSEHSSLINFSEFSESDSFYEGKDWPKFNFIRLKDKLDTILMNLMSLLKTN